MTNSTTDSTTDNVASNVANSTTNPVDTGARTAEAAGAISADRSVIDDLDRRIIALVRERTAVSAGIQRARIASGGRRVSLARETEVIGTYSDRLGRPGTALAMALLELGRGRV